MQKENNHKPSVEEVLHTYSDMIYRLAYARTMNSYDAEDITQNVFLKYMKHADGLLEEEHRKAWLITVTVNEAKSFLTSAWNRKKVAMEENYDAVDERNPFAKAEQEDIFAYVGKLPEKYRIIIHLFYYEQLSILEICNILKKKESTVKSQLHRAREILKKSVKREWFDV